MEAFKTIILIARPAAGKSEIINYLKQCSQAERLSRFHIISGSMDRCLI